MPPGQTRHAAEPVEGWYVPAAHVVHAVEPVLPAYDPAEHAEHAAAPAAEKSPVEQLEHDAALLWLEATKALSER